MEHKSGVGTASVHTDRSGLRTKGMVVAIPALFLAIAPFLPVPAGMSGKGWVALAILLLAIALWFTELIPAPVTGLAVIVLLPLFHVLSFEETASGLGEDVIWLIIAMLMMGVAVEETALGRRFAYGMLSLTKGDLRLTLLAIMLAAFVLTFFVPNGMGRLGVLLPISIGLVEALVPYAGENFQKSVMLAVTFVPYVSTTSLLTGASGSIYVAGLFETTLGYRWSYLRWAAVMLPGTLLTMLLLWWALLRLFPVRVKTVGESLAYFEEQKRALGPLSRAEAKLIGLYGVLIGLWVTKEIHQIPVEMAAVLVVIFLFVPGMGLLDWKEGMKRVDWGIPILFVAGFAIAHGLEKSGLVAWMSGAATRMLAGFSPFWLALTLMLLFMVVRIGFTHFTAMIAAMMPVVFTFARATPYNPVWLGMICVVASSMAYLFPAQSMSNMATYTLGYYTSRDMLLAGSVLSGIVIAVTLLAAFFYWPLIGLPIG